MRKNGHDTMQQGNHFTELEAVTFMAELSLLLKFCGKIKNLYLCEIMCMGKREYCDACYPT